MTNKEQEPKEEECEQFMADFFSNSEIEDRAEVGKEFKQLTKGNQSS
jgi:hypothetical protein